MPGRLSVVATPIGNLEDLTFRALRTLRECDVVFCEDTRVTGKLLARYAIAKPLERLDANTQQLRLPRVLTALREGRHVAYVTDAGTPGVSDPGNVLVARVAAELPDVRIEPIPGPSALTTLASVAGIPTDRFVFLGFLPTKHGRSAALQRIATSEETTIFYESPHRILRTLRELAPFVGDRPVVVGRELTKLHETIVRGSADAAVAVLGSRSIRGELVVAVGGGSRSRRSSASS